VAAGECLVLAGPSGCGKTTTLRLIAGLEKPTAGTICLGGRDVRDVPPWQRDVAMVFQRPALFPTRTVRQNLGLGLHPSGRGWFGTTRPDHGQQVEDMADLLDLAEVLERLPADLSGGQAQRVALGRALLRRAQVLLLDEPLGHLDAPLRRDLRRQLALLHRRFPVTIVHVTHDAEEALALADRVAVMVQGRLFQVGAPGEIVVRPAHRFVAAFCHDLTLVSGTLRQENGHWTLFTGDGRWPIPRIIWQDEPVTEEIEIGFQRTTDDSDMIAAITQGAWIFDVSGRTVGQVPPTG